MSRNTSIILGDHFSDFIAEQVRDGRYGSASEVVRAGLRLLEERETKLQALREAIREGVESGPAIDLDFDDLMRELNAEHGA